MGITSRVSVRARIGIVGFTVIAISVTTLPGAVPSSAGPSPTVTTDKADYAPGETVVITGTGFDANVDLDVPVIRPNGSIVKGDGSFTPGWDTVTSSGDGNFTYNYKLNGIQGEYEVRVYATPWDGDRSKTPIASTTFLDAALSVDQCANGPPSVARQPCPSSIVGPGDGAWQNGNLHEGNSQYREGDSVAFRSITTLPLGETTVSIGYDSIEHGAHAYDYLTSWNETESGDPCDTDGDPATVACPAGGVDTFDIPIDPRVTVGPDGVLGNADDIVQIPGVFTCWGCDITAVGSYSYSGTPSNPPADSDTIETSITLTINVTQSTQVLAWGGHLASQEDWSRNQQFLHKTAVVDVNGSPYHMRNAGSGGAGDRSLKASAVIFPGSITIIKDASPEDGTNFGYTTTGGLTPATFALDDDGDPALSNTQVFSDITNFTTYTITEDALPAGWTLQDITCTVLDPNGGTQTKDLPNRKITIVLKAGEEVTCTFVNTKAASLTINKTALGEDGTFAYTTNGSGLSDFSIATSGGSGTHGPDPFTPAQFGDKYVTETIPAGWTLDDIDCTANGAVIAIGTGQGVAFDQNATADFDAGDTTIKATIGAGDAPVCTYVNAGAAELQVHKSTVGGDGTFDYTGSGTNVPGTFEIATTAGTGSEPAFTFSGTELGVKQITELVESGFTLTGITCSGTGLSYTVGVAGNDASFNDSTFTNGDNSVKVTISAGDAVDCTFTNTRNAELQVHKSTVGGDGTFDYTGSGTNVPGTFEITTVGGSGDEPAFGFSGIQLGLKQITETAEPGFTLTNITCTGSGLSYTVGVAGNDASFDNSTYTQGDNSVKVDISAGDDVDCTFTNTKDAELQIHKTVDGVNDSTFDYIGSGTNVPANFTITTSGGAGSEPPFGFSGVQLGTKQITETPEPGYTLTGIICTGTGVDYTVGVAGNDASFTNTTFNPGDNSVKVDISAGDVVDCTFTNAEPDVRLVKDVDTDLDGDFDDNEPAVAVGDPVQYRIRVINEGNGDGEVPSVVDDYDQAHIDPEAIGDMDPDASSDDGDLITWDGPHAVAANSTITFIYDAVVIGTFSGDPGGLGCAAENDEFPVRNVAAAGPHNDDAIVCVVAQPDLDLFKDVDTDLDGDFDDNEPAVEVGDPVQYRIRVVNDGVADGSVPSVVDDYDEDHIDPEAIGDMDPDASSDDGDVITWDGPHPVAALSTITFTYDATVIGTFGTVPGTNPCDPDTLFPVTNLAVAGDLDDDALICVDADPLLSLVKEVDTDLDGDFDDNEPAVEVGDTVNYRIRVINDGDAAGSVPSVVDDYDQAHVNPEAITDMDPDATSDDGSKITWDGPHSIPALDEITFEYSATVIGTFSGEPPAPGELNPCNPENSEFPVRNIATAGDDSDDAIICVEARGQVTVNKTEGGDTPTRVFTFSLDGPSGHLEASTDDINGGVLEFPDLIPGEYTLCEINIPAGFDSDLTPSLPVGGIECAPSFDVDSGEENEVVFDVDNIPCPDLTPNSDANADPDPGGSVTVTKEIPTGGGPATFTYTLTGPNGSTNVVDTGQIVFGVNETGPKTLVLTTPAGLIGTFRVTQAGPAKFVPQDPIDVTISPDTQTVCSAMAEFPIAQAPPEARVIKTERLSNGTKRAARGVWTFYLIGPDTDAQTPGVQGNTVTKKTNANGARHKLLWGGLEPGDYMLCEKFVGGWKSNLGGASGIIQPNGDRCVTFSLNFDDSRRFRVNNRCPRARTPVPR